MSYVDLDALLRADWYHIHLLCCLGIARSRIGFGASGIPYPVGSSPAGKTMGVRQVDMAELVKSLPPEAQQLPGGPRERFLTFYTGAYMLPVISIRHAPYGVKHLRSQAHDDENAAHFGELLGWIEGCGLFSEVGRVAIFLNLIGESTRVHRDTVAPNHDEFAWMNPSGTKRFSVDGLPVTARAIWFDSHLPHGSPPATCSTYSLRVDGVFSQASREHVANALSGT